ncbi:hypothetical protein C5167_036575 [Papaver somniferum]|uniref:Legumain prodomain domain-containing protein n=1 Tax=Papaver somniferum TaxID=3469 RepID=A0A4Y7I7Y6_PAPSO|nr:vacuolar-processing enzyme-like isoform X1 [Papaver somniferum]XP_026383762.1 vacuolar-processing enzyme-like isoform X1 [Papaver somniferum]RZC43628.1 hypothetical protein C5167_036575 [Papaver somniferum]
MISAFRVFSRVFSTTRAIDENVHLRPELQRLSKQVKVFNKADVKRATKGSLIYATNSPAQAKNTAHEVFDQKPERRKKGVRRTMATGSCTGTHPGDGEHNSSLIIDHKPYGDLVANCDADLIYFELKYQNSPEGSEEKAKAWQAYQNILQQRRYFDSSMDLVGEFIFGTTEKASSVMKAARPAEQPLVDDWTCYKTMVGIYAGKCGPLSPYAAKHMFSLANMSNAGVKPETLAKAFDYANSILGKMPLQHVIHEDP